MVEAEGLTKRFGKVEALAGLTLAAPTGGVLAVLGPNGAGKSTFVRMLATLTTPDAGTLHVAGVDALRHPDRSAASIGLAGQSAAVEEAMTGHREPRDGRPPVRLLAAATPGSAPPPCSSGSTSSTPATAWCAAWSGGMRRRLDLGATLVGEPQVLLLDEPTTGLDPGSRIGLWESVRELVDDGTDVVLTTQYLDEADHLADRIVIIDHGRRSPRARRPSSRPQGGRDVVEAHPRERDQAEPSPTSLGAADRRRAPASTRDTGRVSVPSPTAPAASPRRARPRRRRASPSTTSPCAADPRRDLPRPHRHGTDDPPRTHRRPPTPSTEHRSP